MLHNQDNLALNFRRLTSAEEADQTGEGLVFVFSKDGIGQYATKLATHRVLPGDVLVFNRAAGSKITVYERRGEFIFWMFTLCFENLLPLFASKEISMLHKITECLKTPKIYPGSSSLALSCHRLLEGIPEQFNLEHRGQLIRVAATILSLEFAQMTADPAGQVRQKNHMIRVFERLSASEIINLSVDELAGRFNCGRRHLNRLFHQHFGISVAALKMEMRLLKAISLLRDENVKIINVAEQCGFNHLGPFNTCFKRRFGTSPGLWRKLSFQRNGITACHPGPQLNALGGQREATPRPVMEAIAGKITNGESILEDLERRNLVFGDKA